MKLRWISLTRILGVLTLGSAPPAWSSTVEVSVVHTFHHGPNDPEGERPGTVTVGRDGSLYGTTAAGGPYGAGTIFRIDNDGKFKTIYAFKGTEGSSPDSCLLPGADGNFYGTTGLETNAARKIVFKLPSTGVLSTVALLYLPALEEDRRSVFVKANDGQIYSVHNDDLSTFKLTFQSLEALGMPLFQVVHGRVGTTGIVFTRPHGSATEKNDDAARQEGEHRNTAAPTNPPLCGDVIATKDRHFWGPLLNSAGIYRSVSTNLKDNFYSAIDMFIVTMDGRIVKQVTPNPDYAGVAGAHDRFVEDLDGTVLATSRHLEAGAWHNEIVGVTASGQLTRRISLDSLGTRAVPFCGLLPAADGHFYGVYGVTQAAGDNAETILYRVSSAGQVEIMYRLAATRPGPTIKCPLVRGPEGNIYLTFVDGGKDRQGELLRIAIHP